MSDGEGRVWLLALNLVVLSFLAIGGVAPILPELHRQVVEVEGWMTSQRFTDLFAIAQASPGPNFLVVSLVGLDVAGWPGAVAATLAICGPTCVLAYFVTLFWARFRAARWRIAIQAGLVPVTIGLVCASAYVIARTADTSAALFGVTAVSAAGLYATRLHPMLFLAGGAALGLGGLLQ